MGIYIFNGTILYNRHQPIRDKQNLITGCKQNASDYGFVN